MSRESNNKHSNEHEHSSSSAAAAPQEDNGGRRRGSGSHLSAVDAASTIGEAVSPSADGTGNPTSIGQEYLQPLNDENGHVETDGFAAASQSGPQTQQRRTRTTRTGINDGSATNDEIRSNNPSRTSVRSNGGQSQLRTMKQNTRTANSNSRRSRPQHQHPSSRQENRQKKHDNDGEPVSIPDQLASGAWHLLRAAGGFTLSTTGALVAPPLHATRTFILPQLLAALRDIWHQVTPAVLQEWTAVTTNMLQHWWNVILNTPSGQDVQSAWTLLAAHWGATLASPISRQCIIDLAASWIRLVDVCQTPEFHHFSHQAALTVIRYLQLAGTGRTQQLVWDVRHVVDATARLAGHHDTTLAVAHATAYACRVLELMDTSIATDGKNNNNTASGAAAAASNSSRRHLRSRQQASAFRATTVTNPNTTVEEAILSSLGVDQDDDDDDDDGPTNIFSDDKDKDDVVSRMIPHSVTLNNDNYNDVRHDNDTSSLPSSWSHHRHQDRASKKGSSSVSAFDPNGDDDDHRSLRDQLLQEEEEEASLSSHHHFSKDDDSDEKDVAGHAARPPAATPTTKWQDRVDMELLSTGLATRPCRGNQEQQQQSRVENTASVSVPPVETVLSVHDDDDNEDEDAKDGASSSQLPPPTERRKRVFLSANPDEDEYDIVPPVKGLLDLPLPLERSTADDDSRDNNQSRISTDLPAPDPGEGSVQYFHRILDQVLVSSSSLTHSKSNQAVGGNVVRRDASEADEVLQSAASTTVKCNNNKSDSSIAFVQRHRMGLYGVVLLLVTCVGLVLATSVYGCYCLVFGSNARGLLYYSPGSPSTSSVQHEEELVIRVIRQVVHVDGSNNDVSSRHRDRKQDAPTRIVSAKGMDQLTECLANVLD